jgi:hypothetical protein
VGISFGMTMVFLCGCLLVERWLLKSGYRLKS